MAQGVRVASALSTHADTAQAAHEAAERVAGDLEGAAPHLVCVFLSPHHRDAASRIADILTEELVPQHLIGCTGEWIVGGGKEVEDGPAVSMWAATLPGARIESFHSSLIRTPEGMGFVGIPDLGEQASPQAVLLLADPFTYPAHALLDAASERFPGLPFIGGMASGGTAAGEHRLVRGIEVHDRGAVGVLISGDLPVRTIVSQGCRPIGEALIVTKAEGNVIHELGGRPALERVREVLAAVDERDRQLASEGLHVGVVIDEQREEFGRGDFLVRGVAGADPEQGTLTVGEEVEVGRTIQLHVRDAESADEDLRLLLDTLDSPPAGALLFTCNGRGSRMFPTPDHDAQTIQTATGVVPAGLFCQGEIGPVGGRNFLHGFTASAAFFG